MRLGSQEADASRRSPPEFSVALMWTRSVRGVGEGLSCGRTCLSGFSEALASDPEQGTLWLL